MIALEPEYWRPAGSGAEESGAIDCELCPHRCRIAEGRVGLCKVRRNEGGSMSLPYCGAISALALDPIEKKPLHHFLPGSSVFSAGFVGCNLRCPFCQNWQISQVIPSEIEEYSPEELVKAAMDSGAPSIAYTYSEPCVHFEFVHATMAAARKAGLKNVLVTNGCLNAEPGRRLLELTDAANVDLKSWSASIYREKLGGERDAVLEFIRTAASLCLVEITTLVVPGYSDGEEEMVSLSSFISSVSDEIPLHLSAYHPAWKCKEPETRIEPLLRLGEVARENLKYVYIGNVPGQGADTFCPGCGAKLIARQGYRTQVLGLGRGDSGAFCKQCNSPLHIIV